MAVSFLKHVALEIPTPDLDKAAAFYTDFGLVRRVENGLVSFGCKGRRYDSVYLIAGANK